MKDIAPILCAVFCVITISLAAVPETRAYTLETTYTIEIHTDGTASWTIEQSAYMETESDLTSFSELINQAMTYIDQFTSNVSAIIDQAHDETGRFMTAENISIGGNVSGVGTYAFLDYKFDWTNFAVASNTTIAIGDAFSNDSFMFGDGSLSILLPTGYNVESCSPSPNYDSNGVLEWSSVNSLQDGQPTILLSSAGKGTIFNLTNPLLFEIMLPLIGAFLASLLVLKSRKKNKEQTIETFPKETSKEAEDTERILALIKKEGGQMLQSKITDQLRFSKAKTSRILGGMESKGFVTRHKTGRDKVVSLQNNLKTKKPD